MKTPKDQTIDDVLARLSEWRKCYEELAELETQFTELRTAWLARLENQQRMDEPLWQDVRHIMHVLKNRIAELKEKLAGL